MLLQVWSSHHLILTKCGSYESIEFDSTKFRTSHQPNVSVVKLNNK